MGASHNLDRGDDWGLGYSSGTVYTLFFTSVLEKRSEGQGLLLTR